MATTSDDNPIPAPGARQYEFTPAQDALIADLARKMRFVGFFAMLVGALGVAMMLVAWFRHNQPVADVAAILLLLIGFWTLGAARSFQNVANTQGRDVSHLMIALGSLRTMYGFFYWLLIFGLMLAALLWLFLPTAAAPPAP